VPLQGIEIAIQSQLISAEQIDPKKISCWNFILSNDTSLPIYLIFQFLPLQHSYSIGKIYLKHFIVLAMQENDDVLPQFSDVGISANPTYSASMMWKILEAYSQTISIFIAEQAHLSPGVQNETH